MRKKDSCEGALTLFLHLVWSEFERSDADSPINAVRTITICYPTVNMGIVE